MTDLLSKLDSVYRWHRHVERLMRITDCSYQKAEKILSATDGPQMYRRMLREYMASGGKLADLEPSPTDP